jgi:uncharacterized protein (DUF1697 family)
MARGGDAASVHVALLRGINVGGKNLLPMAELARVFVAAGCGDVRTYIQSGNVVYRAQPALAARVPDLVAQRIARDFGLKVPVVTRSAAELARVATSNPFLRAGADTKELHVAFLAETPAKTAVAALDPRRSPPDELRVAGREVYLHLPNGVARTKLTNAYLDSTLGTTSTLRNWNTVLKLFELASA